MAAALSLSSVGQLLARGVWPISDWGQPKSLANTKSMCRQCSGTSELVFLGPKLASHQEIDELIDCKILRFTN